MKWVAAVEGSTGRAKHLLFANDEKQATAIREFPTAATVEVVPGDDGWRLIRCGIIGEFCGDTWHLTLEEAKHQATFEYGILDSEWIAADSD